MRKRPITGEWQYDKLGRKCRKIGSCIEYMPIVQTTAGTVYADELEAHNKRMKAESERRIREQQEAAREAYTGRECFFKLAKGNMNISCQKDCALYGNNSCSFADTSKPAIQDTKGRYCPIIGRECFTTCAVYNGGCTLNFRA